MPRNDVRRIMKPVAAFITISIMCVFIESICDIRVASAAPYPERFHVEGNKIVNEQSEEMIFRGLDPIDPVTHALLGDQDNGEWSRTYFANMAEWGAKIIRLGVRPYSWRNYGRDASIAVIDQAIEWAGEYGMYVYIDFHSIGYPPAGTYKGETNNTSKPEIMSFWNDISSHYRYDNRVAFYEIFNEPTHTDRDRVLDWLDWRQYAEEIIDTIRLNDPDKTIIVGGIDYAYDLSYVLDYPVRRGNIVYATHPYPGTANWLSWDNAFGSIKAVYPVFATEFGFAPPGYQHSEDEYPGLGIYREAIISYLESKKISWTVWCFSSTWAPSLLSDINLYTPSESGLFFRSKLLEYGTCLDRPVRVIGTDTLYFPALQSAYNVMEDGAIIQGQTVDVSETLYIDLSKSVTMKCGYDCDYNDPPGGETTLQGNMTITSGQLTIESGTCEVK
jgi:hypothetical protein